MKKIMLFLFTILVSLCVFEGVNAEVINCRYKFKKDVVEKKLNDSSVNATIKDDYYIEADIELKDGKISINSSQCSPGGESGENDCSLGYKTFVKAELNKDDFRCFKYLGQMKHENGDLGLGFTDSSTYAVAELVEPNFISQSCLQYKTTDSCKTSKTHACVWVENDEASTNLYTVGSSTTKRGYCNVDNLLFVACGDAKDIPVEVPAIISLIVNLLKIATPIILIFVSVISLLKALSAQKEDEIKKAQTGMVRRIIAAVLVFFVISIVQFVIGIVAENETENANFTNCLDCFLNNSCEDNKYFKTVVAGEDYCTYLSSGVTKKCTQDK